MARMIRRCHQMQALVCLILFALFSGASSLSNKDQMPLDPLSEILPFSQLEVETETKTSVSTEAAAQVETAAAAQVETAAVAAVSIEASTQTASQTSVDVSSQASSFAEASASVQGGSSAAIFFQSQICYGARDDSWATVNLPYIPANSRFIFTHRSGTVGCAGGHPSKWGCNNDWPFSFGVRNTANGLILPDPNDPSIRWLFQRTWWTKNGYTFDRSTIELNNANALAAGAYRFGYGEDFDGWTEGDNFGRACFDVSVVAPIFAQTNICYGARDNSWQNINLPNIAAGSRFIASYRSGGVGCAGSAGSKWGCWSNYISFGIRSNTNALIVPDDKDESIQWLIGRTWWTKSGYAHDQAVLEMEANMAVAAGTYRAGYGEDFDDYTEGDNVGRMCFDLYIYDPSPFKPEAHEWRCVNFGGSFTPIRMSPNSLEVECMANDYTNCRWTDANGCNVALTSPSNPVKPLACGAMHQQRYGSGAYDVANHWCAISRNDYITNYVLPASWTPPSNQYCFGARDNTWANVNIPTAIPIGSKIRIKFRSGAVSCAYGSKYNFSKWGCAPDVWISFQIRNAANGLMVPDANDPKISWSAGRVWWNRAGTTNYQDVLEFVTMTEMTAGTYRFGYGEDFDDYTEGDNSGSTCFELEIERSAAAANVMCYGTRDNTWGSLYIGNVLPKGTTFRVRSLSGTVSCAAGDPNNFSKWGCNPSEWLSFNVRSSANTIVAPTYADPDIVYSTGTAYGTWWKRTGVTNNDAVIRVRTTEEWPAGTYRFGYAEDFADWTEGDNGGRVCVEVFIELPGSGAVATLQPKLWLKADGAHNFKLDGDKIIEWVDQSGNGNGMKQATAANRPRLVSDTVDATKSYVMFEGNQFLSGLGAITAGNKRHTIVIAFRFESCPGGQSLFDQGGTAAMRANERTSILGSSTCNLGFCGESCDNWDMTTFETGRLVYAIYRSDNANLDFWYNGEKKNSATHCGSYNPQSNVLYIGSKIYNYANERLNGRMYEVIVYDTTLTDDQIKELHRSWFLNKYVSPLPTSYCFGARDDTWASINVATPIPSGSIIKLTHRSGAVSCAGEGNYNRWGCAGVPDLLGVQVRTSTNVLISPLPGTADSNVQWHGSYPPWYKRTGAMGNDPVLRLPVLKDVAAGVIRIGYGEDFDGWTESDNVGRTCFEVAIETPGSQTVINLKPSFWLRSDASTNFDIDATDTNRRINRWFDQSGNNNHVTQLKNDNKPIFTPSTDANSKTYVQFNGNQWLTGLGAFAANNKQHTVIAVYQQDSCPAGASIFDQGGIAAMRQGERSALLIINCKMGFNGESCDNHQLYDLPQQKLTYTTYRSNGNDLDFWQDGSKKVSATRCSSWAPKSDTLYIGSKIYNFNSERFFGRMYEMIVFDKTLTDAQLNDLHNNWYKPKYDAPAKFCYGARDNTWAVVNIPQAVAAGSTINIRHRSGTTSCAYPGNDSKWGCGPSQWLSFQVRDTNNVLVAPSPFHPSIIYQQSNWAWWTNNQGITNNDNIIKLPVFDDLPAGNYRFGYGEDFVDFTEADNAGTVCFDYTIDPPATPAPTAPQYCFGTRDNSWANIALTNVTTAGSVIKIKYTKGFSTCAYNSANTNTYSNWGCDPSSLPLSFQIRSSSNAVVLPSLNDKSITWTYGRSWWTRTGVTAKDNILNLYVTDNLPAGTYRFGYGEDFDDYTESDNYGKTCFTYEIIPNALPFETDICFGTRDSSWAMVDFFTDLPPGARVSVTHRSGSVSCAPGINSNWGCDPNSALVAFQIRSAANAIILPDLSDSNVQWTSPKSAWSRSGVTPNDKTLSLIVMNTMPAGRYRFGYGEDFEDYTEADNSGRTCFDVKVERAATCVPATSISTGYSVISTKSALCTGAGSDNNVVYYGAICDGNKKIQWYGAQTPKPRTGLNVASQCSWNINPGDASWTASYMGGCGVAPTEVPHLPTSTCEVPERSCVPADQLTSYTVTSFSTPLGGGDGGDFKLIYSGIICEAATNKIQWIRVRSSKSATSVAAGSAVWNFGYDTAWNTRFMGSCGVAPTEVPHLPTRTCNAPPARACIPASQLATGYTVDNYHSDFCAGVGSDNKVTYYGTTCGNSTKIQWHRMMNTKPRTGLTAGACRWNIGSDATWNARYIGGCGVAPIIAPDLPTNVCEVQKPNCVPSGQLTSKGYTATTFSSALCSGDGSDNQIVYSGAICDTVTNKIQWNKMIMPVPRTGQSGCNWSRGTDASWNALYVGSCGVAPSIVPDLPTVTCDSPLTECRRAVTTITTLVESDTGSVVTSSETRLVNCTLDEALSLVTPTTTFLETSIKLDSSSKLLETNNKVQINKKKLTTLKNL